MVDAWNAWVETVELESPTFSILGLKTVYLTQKYTSCVFRVTIKESNEAVMNNSTLKGR